VRGTHSGDFPTMLTDGIEAIEEWLIDLDDGADRLFQPYIDSPPVRALDVVSKLGDQPQIRLMAAGLIVAGTFADNARLVRAGARMIIAHEAATLAKDLMKTLIDRTRPRSARGRDEKKPKSGDHTAKERTSFPSGHSAGAVAAARAFSREFPEHGPKAIGAAAFIAASQVPRSAHYPTDVAAGLAIGLAFEAVTNAAWHAAGMDQRSTE
jgi:membrane-associated phospholipid phosphatase